MTSTITPYTPSRTYTVGDYVTISGPDYVEFDARCRETQNGYHCTLPSGHVGIQHVAAQSHGYVVEVWDRDTSGDPVESEWKPGDLLRRPTYPRLNIGQVLHVDEGGLWVVGQGDDDERHGLKRLTTLDNLIRVPAEGPFAAPLPTLADVGAALAERHTLLDRTVREARGERDQAQSEAARVQSELEEFRLQVARVAMQKAREHGWCSVVKRALEDMGLEPSSRYRVEVEVTATRTIQVEVDAEDGEAAWRAVDAMDASELADAYERHTGDSFDRYVLDSGGWEHHSHDASTDVVNLDD